MGRGKTIARQAEHARAFAREFGFLKQIEFTADQLLDEDPDLLTGAEHTVDLSAEHGRVAKLTLPDTFGLVPAVISSPTANLPGRDGEPKQKKAIEIISATPLEYLERWIASNDVFKDKIEFVSVIEWADGKLSFGITQPQYHGHPASDREIMEHFKSAGWVAYPHKGGHEVYFNYAFNVLAVDALPRNCYINDEGQLMPFDVILRHPDESLEAFLGIYP